MPYKKAPAYEGKDLTINVGRSDMKILDGVKYNDTRLARFVGMGMLVECKADDKAPTVATAPPAEKKVADAKKVAAAKKAKKVADAKKAKKAKGSQGKDQKAAAGAASADGGSVSKSPAAKMGGGGRSTSTKTG